MEWRGEAWNGKEWNCIYGDFKTESDLKMFFHCFKHFFDILRNDILRKKK